MNRIALSLVTIWAVLAGIATADPVSWTHWRGPLQTGAALDTGLPEVWSSSGTNLLWSAPYGARTAPIVMNGRVYLINGAGAGETMQARVVCLDFETGKLVWEYRYEVFLTDIVFHRVGWANLCGDPETGNLYAHGIEGMLHCFDQDGHVLWSRSLTEEFGRISGYGGRVYSPVIDGNLLIIGIFNSGWGAHARPVHRFAAMDKRTGEMIWWSSPSGQPMDTTYSIPVIATLDGVRVLFTGLADGAIAALKVNTGEPIWSFKLSKRGINTSVVTADGLVYATHGAENFGGNEMGRVVCINARGNGDITESGEVWRRDGIEAGYSSPTLHDGLLYVPDNAANLHCLDAGTGEEYWSFNYGNAGKGSGVLADGKFYIGEMSGTYHVLAVSKRGCRRLSRVTFQKQDGSPIEIYGTPAVAGGRVLLPTQAGLYCIGLAGGRAGKPPARSQSSPKSSGEAAWIQITPAETWLQGGVQQTFRVSAFDDKGIPIKSTPVQWSQAGLPGAISGDGVYSAELVGVLKAGTVNAVYGDLKASSRVRVLPVLPYFEGFESHKAGAPPPGWITSKLKCRIVEMDGQHVLKKLADRPSPPFARFRCYMLPPMEIGYTVQADLNGQSKKKRFKPDMGLINARYKLIMVGTTRKPMLRLVAWDPMPRLQKDVEFDWEPSRWYTAKLTADRKNGRTIVRGKAWPRGDDEPEAWSIEMTDPAPHSGGSPGLYAYSVAITAKSTGTEVYFDNVRVTLNED